MEAALPLTADEVTSALEFDGADLAASLGDKGLIRTLGDVSLLITWAPIPQLNGMLTLRTSARAADVSDLLDFVASKNVPHSSQIRPGCDPDLIDLPKGRGLVEDAPLPLMTMRSATEQLRGVASHP